MESMRRRRQVYLGQSRNAQHVVCELGADDDIHGLDDRVGWRAGLAMVGVKTIALEARVLHEL
jgi:hypothetical protein